MAAVGLAALALGDNESAIVRTLSPIHAAGMLLLPGTSIFFSVAQGIVTCSVIGILFALAWWLA